MVVTGSKLGTVRIRPLVDVDVEAARRIVSLAFGTFLNAPDPSVFMADRDYVGTRVQSEPRAAFAAEIDGRVVGSNFAVRWGSVGFFGPLTVDPEYWDRGVGQRLMEPVLDCFDRWELNHTGLFTFAHSPKHVALYRRFGFWPRALTAITSKSLEGASEPVDAPETYSGHDDPSRESILAACRALTDALFPGLDLSAEIDTVEAQHLGETVLLREEGEIVGFAVAHLGMGTEAGEGTCYVKFGMVPSGPGAEGRFRALLGATKRLAIAAGQQRLVAGVNLAREDAARALFEQGFHTVTQGVAMHRPNEPGYSHSDAWVLDDWR